MKTTMLTFLFLLIFASAFCQTKSGNLFLNQKASVESLLQNGAIYNIHFDTTLSLFSQYESTNGVGLGHYNLRGHRFQPKFFKDEVPHLINNGLNCINEGNDHKNCKSYRINRIITPVESTNGSKLLWLMGGMIKYSQFKVTKGDYSWDNGSYRFYTQNIITRNIK